MVCLGHSTSNLKTEHVTLSLTRTHLLKAPERAQELVHGTMVIALWPVSDVTGPTTQNRPRVGTSCFSCGTWVILVLQLYMQIVPAG